MTLNAVRKAKLFIALAFATFVFAGAANAQPTFSGRFTLPYEVQWGGAVLPAGNYSILMDRFAGPAIVQSATGKIQIPVLPVVNDSKSSDTCLLITVRGGQRRVRALNLPQLGVSLVYQRFSKAEREDLAKADQSQSVPLVLAQN